MPDSGGSDSLQVNGSVAAGVWRESDHWNDDRQFVIRLASPIPGEHRFGLVVEGNSMDLDYEPGAVLDCISAYAGQVTPKNGDHVIVERRRPDGLRELTVKEYQETDGRYLLVPRSTKSEFKVIEYDGPDAGEDRDADKDHVQIIAFVVASYPPKSLELLKRMGLLGKSE